MKPEGAGGGRERAPAAEQRPVEVLFELLRKLGRRGSDLSPDVVKEEGVEFTPARKAVEEVQ